MAFQKKVFCPACWFPRDCSYRKPLLTPFTEFYRVYLVKKSMMASEVDFIIIIWTESDFKKEVFFIPRVGFKGIVPIGSLFLPRLPSFAEFIS